LDISLKLAESCLCFDFSGRGEEQEISTIPLFWSKTLQNSQFTQPIYQIILGEYTENIKISCLKIISEIVFCRANFFKRMQDRQKFVKDNITLFLPVLNYCVSNPLLYQYSLFAFFKFSVFFLIFVRIYE